MAHARRSLRNHHGKPHEHAPGDPLGVYLPPLAKWKKDDHGMRSWRHPELPLRFTITASSGGVAVRYNDDYSYDETWFDGPSPRDVLAAMKVWYSQQTMASLRRAARNPDWSAIRAKASHYGSRAAAGAREAYAWTAPRAKRAAEVTWEGAKSAGRAVKRGAKRAAPVVARGARSAAESMDRWAQTNGRCAMRNGASLTKAQTDALVEAYAKYKYAGRKGAPMKVQQRFYDRYDSLLGKALEKFGMRIAPQEFTDELDRRADKWLRERPVVGAGTFW